MKISCIYLIENLVSHKMYVGQTSDFKNRKSSHLSSLRRGKAANKHLQRSFNKYGEDNFDFRILELCDPSQLNEREQYWIKTLDTYNTGYNMDMGGNGIRGYHFTDEQKEKIRQANKGRIVSDITKQRMRDNHADFRGEKHPNFGVKWSDHVSVEKQIELRRHYSEIFSGEGNPNYGKKMSDEQKQKLSESHKRHYQLYGNPLKGRKFPERSGENAVCQRPVICLNTQETFSLIKFAAEKFSIAPSRISACCSNATRYAGYNENGYELFWMYLDEYEKLSDTEKSNVLSLKQSWNRKPIDKKVYCITTGEIFNSMKSACEKYHIDPSSLSGHCKGRKSKNGCGRHPITNELLKWEYVD